MLEPQQRIVDIVNYWVGAKLGTRENELRAFLSRFGIDNPRTIIDPKVSTCGLFALAVWAAAGVDHPLCRKRYEIGAAVTWVGLIARDLQAVCTCKRNGLPQPGDLMHYYSARPSFDDHLEFLLATPSCHDTWIAIALHGGGGRSDCGVNSNSSNIRFNSGRPLQCWYSAERLLAGSAEVTEDEEQPETLRGDQL